MFSYIFMKILESRPHRYDLGLNLLTLGQARRIKKQIVNNFVRKGIRMLDVGCGTGTLVIEAAQKGAEVVGLDISEGMLEVARERAVKHGVDNNVNFRLVAATESDKEFEGKSFDLITCTHVLSELSRAERQWALRGLHKILKPGGKLIVVAEVRPKGFFKQCVYYILRAPLAAVTYLVAQSGTRPVSNIVGELTEAGFEMGDYRYTFFGSLATIVAERSERIRPSDRVLALKVEEDKSLLKTVLDYIGRWFPNPVEPGLRLIGDPGTTSPVIVTANFHLTVRRVEKSLEGENCYLIVANSKGINVWCASAGGDMSTETIISALETSRISDHVDHRQLILPQLCAPGVDVRRIKERTGWNARWGPVYARDLPYYISQGFRKNEKQSRAHFSLPFRMEMLLCMNWMIWAGFAIVFLLAFPERLIPFTTTFWIAGLVLYGGYYFLPFRSGWAKALIVGGAAIVSIWQGLLGGKITDMFQNAGWLALTYGSIFSIGFDLKGIVGDQSSEAEGFLYRLGLEGLGHLYKAKGVHRGTITKYQDLCINCGTCIEVCPMGVHAVDTGDKKVRLAHELNCIRCKACVRRCPKSALKML